MVTLLRQRSTWPQKAALVLVALLVGAAQLIPVMHANPPERDNPLAPAPILLLLRRGCYDCHSNQSRWPWYSFIAPVSWLVSYHVSQARRRLNFSEWDGYASDPDTAAHKLDEIAAQVESGTMAPWYYRAMHSSARLTAAERLALIRWARVSSAAMKSAD